MRVSKLIALIMALAGGLAAPATADDNPRRVVSMNLCTDQLAMLLAAPGQLYSVSHLARDPRGSAMAEEAQQYRPNHGRAEEIYLMRPDLVIAGRFSNRATVSMLERLGIPVLLMDPAYSFDAVRDHIAVMGAALGREDAAEQMTAEFDAGLSRLSAEPRHRPTAALYSANGYTSGNQTLAGQILVAAGFENAAVKAGFDAGGFMPLEVLALLEPDALITGRRYPAASRAEEILDHPIVQNLRHGSASGSITDNDWICGTPHVLRAIKGLGTLRQKIEVN